MPKYGEYGAGSGYPTRKKPIEVLPRADRILKGTTIVRQVIEVDRCAAKTKKGQCTGIVGGTGAESGYVRIRGENVPFCGRHYDDARPMDDGS